MRILDVQLHRVYRSRCSDGNAKCLLPNPVLPFVLLQVQNLLFLLLIRVAFTTPWPLPGPEPVGEEATIRIGEHLFSDYLLPFELASVLLLMSMIGAIVLARRDVLSSDVITGEAVDQGLIEKERTPLLLENSPR